MALPKANRLRRREDFNRVYQKGIRRKSANLTLVALRHRRSGQNHNRPSPLGQLPLENSEETLPQAPALAPTTVGISISQKVSKRAVVRNRIKRRIRAAMRQFLPRIADGWELVVVVHPPAIQCDYGEFLRELEQLLIDAEVLHGYS